MPAPALAEAPLSAIDWLSRSITAPVAPASPPERPEGGTSAPLPDAPIVDAAGLLTPRQTGLPRNLWGNGDPHEIAAQITAMQANSIPALEELSMNLLLTESRPPGGGDDGLVFFARMDKLLALGALDQAQALLDAAGASGLQAFRRQFDIALLQGTEDRACEVLDAAPQLAPTYPARIFCLARSGDWPAAVVVLHTAQALSLVTPEEDALISRFLDPDLFEGEPPLPPPARPTPLEWRMFEAIGQPLPTYTLPLAFAHAELRVSSGWKAQLDAAERLARAGVLDPNQLLGLYTLQRPAASGGVWDRVAAVQALDQAVSAADVQAVEQALPIAWDRMTHAEIEVPFARIYASQLLALPLTGDAARLAFRLGLVAGLYAEAAAERTAPNAEDDFLLALAQGDPVHATAGDALSRAIAEGFRDHAAPSEVEPLLAQQRTGEAVMLAMDHLSRGASGDLRAVTEGLATLRVVGLQTAARRVALQLMILERQG